jgi:group I intron endonuclease
MEPILELKIYKLIDPRDGEIRYVGLTFNSISQRLKSHRNEKSKSHKSNWIKSLRTQGFYPLIEIIETVYSYEDACEREIFWISKMKEEGHNLTNHASGGNKNKKMSEETRLKMSESRKEWCRNNKVTLTNEKKQQLSKIRKEIMSDPKQREKLRIANKRYEDSKTQSQKIKDIISQKHTIVDKYDKEMNFICSYLSIRDAERQTSVNRSNITKCCEHKVLSAGGYVWRYENDTTPILLDKRKFRSGNVS